MAAPGRGGPPPPNPTFELPIRNLHDNVNLKNILASSVPKFYDLVTKDLDTFLFDFDILCRSYDYTTDAHKLNLFSATLKEASLKWFMSLGRDAVTTWDEMKGKFLEKYKDYCR